MCKYKQLTKPNHWRIVLFLDMRRQDRYSVNELSKELNMDASHVRKYLSELEDLGVINTYKLKGKLEVIL